MDAKCTQTIKVVILTGDSRTMAEAIARQPGITEIEADFLRQHNSRIVERLRRQVVIAAMAGDGVQKCARDGR